jgi:DNA-binding NarL/FixJ family response regulator
MSGMRVVLVGRAVDRDRLRLELIESGIEIAAETSTLTAARESGVQADAFVVARSGMDDRPGAERTYNEPLTPRELDVLNLIALGLPNKAIADRLGISDQTVKFHVASIISKLGASNRTEAVRVAVRRGLIAL